MTSLQRTHSCKNFAKWAVIVELHGFDDQTWPSHISLFSSLRSVCWLLSSSPCEEEEQREHMYLLAYEQVLEMPPTVSSIGAVTVSTDYTRKTRRGARDV